MYEKCITYGKNNNKYILAVTLRSKLQKNK